MEIYYPDVCYNDYYCCCLSDYRIERFFMSDKYKNGDVFIRFGKIYQIFKIETKKIAGGSEQVIFYKKLFPGKNGEIICSIPMDNLERIKIRKPYSKKEIKDFFKFLKQDPDPKKEFNFKLIKDPYSFDLDDVAAIIKKLRLEEKNPKITLTFSKRDLLTILFDSIKEEIAYVLELDLNKAEEKINSALNV